MLPKQENRSILLETNNKRAMEQRRKECTYKCVEAKSSSVSYRVSFESKAT